MVYFSSIFRVNLAKAGRSKPSFWCKQSNAQTRLVAYVSIEGGGYSLRFGDMSGAEGKRGLFRIPTKIPTKLDHAVIEASAKSP